MLDHGSGIPIVLVPGIQGRWEWMQRAVDALATQNRVITDSFPSKPGSIASINTKRGFDSFIDWLDQLLARANVDTVALCGVSYGGMGRCSLRCNKTNEDFEPNPSVNAFTKLATTLSYRALSAVTEANGAGIHRFIATQAVSRTFCSLSITPAKVTLRCGIPCSCRNFTSDTNANG